MLVYLVDLMVRFWGCSDHRPLVEVNVLLVENLDGHVVHGGHLLFQHDGLEEGFHAVVALHVGMLGDEEGDAALAEAFGILLHHVVTHDLDVAAVGAQEKFTHNVGFRAEGDAMVCLRVLGEDFYLIELYSLYL